MHRKEAPVGVYLLQKCDIKTKYKSRVTCSRFQKKGHFSYECKSPAPFPRYEAVVHINAKDNISGDIPWRQIMVTKSRARYIRINIPVKRLPKRIIIELMKFFVVWINAFPVKSVA